MVAPDQNLINDGGDVLLYLSRAKRWLLRTSKGAKFHTHAGIVDLGSLIGAPYGSEVTSSSGQVFYALRPTIEDYVMKSPRLTQIAYPKDIGLIVMKTGLCPGCKVIEVGTGSGALTIVLASMVRPNGHVYTYEARETFARLAEKNLERTGVREFVTVKVKDAAVGFDEEGADIAIIDVGDPWSLVAPAWMALKGGGRIAMISPTINQVEKAAARLSQEGFVDIEAVEVLLRGLEAREGMTRPYQRMIGHTAYLIFARKTVTKRKA